MKVVVSWSGGKDSQASLIWAVEKYGSNNVQAVFCDTGWEHELTPVHVRSVCEQLGVELIILKSKRYDGFVNMAKKKGRFPSAKARFCTEELKIKPMVDWILDNPEDRYIIQGIRAQESKARAQMEKQCTYFKYYFQPYNGKGKKLSYRIKDVREYVKEWTTDIIRPVFDWSAQQVIRHILDHSQKPNPLYYMGFKRVGCFPCVMCNLNEIRLIAENHSEYITRLEDVEGMVGETSSFFHADTIPPRARLSIHPNGSKIAKVKDVVNYVTRNKNQISLFKEEKEPPSCMSAFHICE